MADPADLFDSPWLKWAWAVRHAEALKAYVEAYGVYLHEHPLAPVRTEYQPHRHCFAVFLTEAPHVPSVLGAALGDVVHNYRSSLDHLAWALVSRGRTPPSELTGDEQGKVYFPIYSGRIPFNASLPKKLPGVCRADIALVRQVQPYINGQRKAPRHPLAILHQLSNGDKHRVVQPIYAEPGSGIVTITRRQDCVITGFPATSRRLPLQVGTELHRIYVRRTGPNPELDVQCAITPVPTVQENLGLGKWLDATQTIVHNLLARFADIPDYIKDMPLT